MSIIQGAMMSALIMIFVLWSTIWKGIALWKAARANRRNWFIALLFINTVGLLEILYIFVFDKKNK